MRRLVKGTLRKSDFFPLQHHDVHFYDVKFALETSLRELLQWIAKSFNTSLLIK